MLDQRLYRVGAATLVAAALVSGPLQASDTPGRLARDGIAVLQVAVTDASRSQSTEWYGRVVAQSDLEGIAGARITTESVPRDGLRGVAVVAPEGTEPALRSASSAANGAFAIEAARGTRLRLAAPGFLDGFVYLRTRVERSRCSIG